MTFELRHDDETLLFRRQFALGPSFLPALPFWKRVEVSSSLRLTAHPELQVEHCSRESASVTVLGNILDPDRPEATNLHVANRLLCELERCLSLDKLLLALSSMGGRWALIATLGGERRLVHDATGARQVYYTNRTVRPDLGLWCTSSLGLIARVFDSRFDPAALTLIQSAGYKTQSAFWWPCGCSPYLGVKSLVPNHYLDLGSGAAHRFWPHTGKGRLECKEAVARTTELLRGTLRAALNRSKLSLSITAGRDSRVSLAACREIRDLIHYSSFIHGKISPRHPDIVVPARLLKSLGLIHHVIPRARKMMPAFQRVFDQNNPVAHEDWGAIAQAKYEHWVDGFVWITSTVSELGRCFYYQWSGLPKLGLNGKNLARIAQLGTSTLVVDTFDQWLASFSDLYDFDVLDLFYWEQRMGSWGAAIFSEWDIVHDGFSPFNCRDLISSMLAVDEEYRKPPQYTLHTKMIEEMWPEVLREPINPKFRPNFTNWVKGKASRALLRGRKKLKSLTAPGLSPVPAPKAPDLDNRFS